MNAFTIPKSTFAQQLQSNKSKGKTPKPRQHIVIPPTDKHKQDWIAAMFAR